MARGRGDRHDARHASARPSRSREAVVNDETVERTKLVDDVNTLIMEEGEREQCGAPP